MRLSACMSCRGVSQCSVGVHSLTSGLFALASPAPLLLRSARDPPDGLLCTTAAARLLSLYICPHTATASATTIARTAASIGACTPSIHPLAPATRLS